MEEAFMRIVSGIDVSEISSPPPKNKATIEKKYDDLFKQAEYAYSQTVIDDFDYQTDKLLTLLQNAPTEFSGEFMLKILKRIEISHSGIATFVFINNKHFRGELVLDART